MLCSANIATAKIDVRYRSDPILLQTLVCTLELSTLSTEATSLVPLVSFIIVFAYSDLAERHPKSHTIPSFPRRSCGISCADDYLKKKKSDNASKMIPCRLMRIDATLGKTERSKSLGYLTREISLNGTLLEQVAAVDVHRCTVRRI